MGSPNWTEKVYTETENKENADDAFSEKEESLEEQ